MAFAIGSSRRAAGAAELSIGGERVRILGRVAMDQVVVDLGDLDAWAGASVRIFGARDDDPTLREWARWCGTSPAAVTSTLGPRIERVWSEGR